MKTFYHYTNIEGMYGMLSSGKAWLSSLALMNDIMEGYDFHETLREVLKVKFTLEQTSSTLDLIKTTIDTHLRQQMSFSVSSLEDDISQWRAYSDLGRGICIEIKENFFLDRSIKLTKCEYDKPLKFKSILKNQSIPKGDQNLENTLEAKKYQEFIDSIVNVSFSFKHKSFAPEKEYRWLKKVTINSNDYEIKYRPHRLGLTSYIEAEINKQSIKSVTIGPGMPAQNKLIIEDFLIKNGISGYTTQSQVTLR